MAGWIGNITLKMNDKEDTFSPGTIEVDRYGDDAISLTFTSGDSKSFSKVRFSKKDCKELVYKLVTVL